MDESNRDRAESLYVEWVAREGRQDSFDIEALCDRHGDLAAELRAVHEEFARAVKKVAILAGVGPLKSTGMARYMRDKVPGMMVPDVFVDRMANVVKGIEKEDKKARQEAWRAEGIQICIELVR